MLRHPSVGTLFLDLTLAGCALRFCNLRSNSLTQQQGRFLDRISVHRIGLVREQNSELGLVAFLPQASVQGVGSGLGNECDWPKGEQRNRTALGAPLVLAVAALEDGTDGGAMKRVVRHFLACPCRRKGVKDSP